MQEVSIEYKVAAMEAELLSGRYAELHLRKPVLVYKATQQIAPARNHRTPEGREWFCEQLRLSVDATGFQPEQGWRAWMPATQESLWANSRSRAIELAIEAEAERRWKEKH